MVETAETVIIAEPQWIGPVKSGRPAWYKAGHRALLGSKAAAARLGTTRKTLYKWARRYPEDLRGTVILGSTFYATEVLDAFLRKHRRAEPSARGRKLIDSPD